MLVLDWNSLEFLLKQLDFSPSFSMSDTQLPLVVQLLIIKASCAPSCENFLPPVNLAKGTNGVLWVNFKQLNLHVQLIGHPNVVDEWPL